MDDLFFPVFKEDKQPSQVYTCTDKLDFRPCDSSGKDILAHWHAKTEKAHKLSFKLLPEPNSLSLTSALIWKQQVAAVVTFRSIHR